MKHRYIALFVLLAGACFATLSNTYAPAQYDCDGGTTEFTVNYTFFETTDLQVYLIDATGSSTLLVEGSGAGKYTVYAPNNDYSDGCIITTGSTYDSTYRIVISREVPYGQQLSIGGDFVPAKPLEQQLDKLAAQIQQVDDGIGRTITAPVTDPSSISLELPNAETRAGKIAGFDSTGAFTALPVVQSGTVYADGTTLDISVANVLSVKAGGIGATQLNATVYAMITNPVTASGISDSAVTSDKIATGAVNSTKVNFIIDDDTMATASPTNVPSAESIKAYVDASVSGAWTSYTPVVSQGTATNIAKTINYAKWVQIGKTVHCNVYVTITGSGQSGQAINVTLPSTPLYGMNIGSFHMVDTGVSYYAGAISHLGLGACAFYTTANDVIGESPSWALANNDFISFAVTYEVE